METQGAKEVRDAVLIAALSAIATGLINWTIEVAKKKANKSEEKK